MEALTQHIEKLKASGGRSHVMGLVSPGGVHSMQHQMAAAVKAIHDAGIEVVVHGFTDGRDVPPSDAKFTLPEFVESLPKSDKVSMGSLTGRYYALDRDNRWERVTSCYDAMVLAKGVANNASDAMSALNQGYDDVLTRPGKSERSLSVWYYRGDQLLAVDAINDAAAYVTAKKLLERGGNVAKAAVRRTRSSS